VKFVDVESLFSKENWDIGYLSKENLRICSNKPIKSKSQQHGWDFTNDIYWSWVGILNGIILVRNSEVSLDYNLYEEASEILKNKGLKEFEDWGHIFMNFKEAQILAGIGIRARNSLVHNRKFGFDSKICVIGFKINLTNPPNNPPNFALWDECTGCDDCRVNCPVGAINNKKEPYWLDSEKCNGFVMYGNHPRIPSVKQFWHKHVHPELPQETVDNMKDNLKDEMAWDANGYSMNNQQVYKNGKQIPIPACRECQVQPRCSKWAGHYPYKKVECN
tara:strand:+ start:54 stop:881 length:828 start_codon:yes stop_codon:yes gene_type:complete